MLKTRICPICEAESSSEYEYCKECGAILPAVDTGTTKNHVADNTATNAVGEDAGAKKYCGACGACAQAADRFCNKCGTHFADIKQEPFNIPNDGRTTQSSANNYSYNGYYTYASADDSTIFGIDENDMREFIGPNAQEYAGKFKRMELTRSKASWNWPVFIFSFFLNIPFVWFFYRKMYKIGAILLAISVAVNVVLFSLSVNYISPILDYTKEILDSTISQSEEFYESDYYFDEYADDEYVENYIEGSMDDLYDRMDEGMPYSVGTNLISLAYLALIIVISILANKMYLNHCVKKIGCISGTDPMRRSFLINKKGGTSTALAVSTGIGIPVVLFIIKFVIIITLLVAMFV